MENLTLFYFFKTGLIAEDNIKLIYWIGDEYHSATFSRSKDFVRFAKTPDYFSESLKPFLDRRVIFFNVDLIDHFLNIGLE